MATNPTVRKNRRERKKARTEAEIVAAATELFHQRGFEGTTMEQIAETADISKGTLYNYFPSKEAVLSVYWQDQMRSLQANIGHIIQQHPDTPARILALLESVMNMLTSRQAMYEPYARYRLQNMNNPKLHVKLRSGLDVLLSDILLRGQQEGHVRTDFPLPMLIAHLEGIFMLACMDWLARPDSFSIKSDLQTAVRLFFQGAAARPASEEEPTR
jgi:AcrR family transcriptional regulator